MARKGRTLPGVFTKGRAKGAGHANAGTRSCGVFHIALQQLSSAARIVHIFLAALRSVSAVSLGA